MYIQYTTGGGQCPTQLKCNNSKLITEFYRKRADHKNEYKHPFTGWNQNFPLYVLPKDYTV